MLDCSDTEVVDPNGRAALSHAASKDVVPVKMLLGTGCNVNHRDKEGLTELHLAISYNRGEIVRTLSEHNLDYHG